MSNHFLYCLETSRKVWYIGATKNYKRRIKKHNVVYANEQLKLKPRLLAIVSSRQEVLSLEKRAIISYRTHIMFGGLNKTFGGDSTTEESIKKISESLKGRKKKKRVCPFCGVRASVANLAKWHFDFCPENPEGLPRPKIKNRKIKNPSKKITCPYCNWTGDPANARKNHFDFCPENPKKKKKKFVICPHCRKEGDPGSFAQNHFQYCKENPDRHKKPKRKYKKSKCPHCQKKGTLQVLKSQHFQYCKENPNRKMRKSTKVDCPHCGIAYNPGYLASSHIKYCKENPNKESRPKMKTKLCMYCKQDIPVNNFSRFHGDQCKCRKE